MMADEAENDLARKGDGEVMRVGWMEVDGGDRRDLKIEFRRGSAMFLDGYDDDRLCR